MPKARPVLQMQFGEQVGEHYDIGILRPEHIADVTGDGVPEALVWLATGGASTSTLALMQIEVTSLSFPSLETGKVRLNQCCFLKVPQSCIPIRWIYCLTNTLFSTLTLSTRYTSF